MYRQGIAFLSLIAVSACGGSSGDTAASPFEPVTVQQDDQTIDVSDGTDAADELNGGPVIEQTEPVVAEPEPIRGPCVDTAPLNDGFGWDGVETCVTPIIAVEEVEPVESAPPTEFSALASDPVWPFCEVSNPDVTLTFGETWGTIDNSRNSSRRTPGSCVRRCEASATQLSGAPGWGYDTNAAAECLFEFDDNPTNSVPVYDPEENSRLRFGDQFAFHLYASTGPWECFVETRESNEDSFIPNGQTLSFNFTDEGVNWRFATASSRRILQVRENPEGPFDYAGHAIIDHNSLAIYRHSQERLDCSAQNPPEEIDLPANQEAFEQAPSVGIEELLGRTMNCRVIESLIRSQNTLWEVGYESRVEAGIEFTITPELANTTGNQKLYDFNSEYRELGTRLYAVSDDVFSYSQNGTSSFRGRIRFKDTGTHLLAEKFDACFASGGCADQIAYSTCQ